MRRKTKLERTLDRIADITAEAVMVFWLVTSALIGTITIIVGFYFLLKKIW